MQDQRNDTDNNKGDDKNCDNDFHPMQNHTQPRERLFNSIEFFYACRGPSPYRYPFIPCYLKCAIHRTAQKQRIQSLEPLYPINEHPQVTGHAPRALINNPCVIRYSLETSTPLPGRYADPICCHK